ncbi:MAG: hypothetical protein ABJC04_01045 [Verrucomicrobiota bacterium]
MRSSILRRMVGALVVAILLGLGIGWWVSRNPRPAPSSVASSVPAPVPPSNNLNPKPMPEPTVAAPVTNALPPELLVEKVDLEDPANWEDKLADVLGSDTEDGKKGEELLQLMGKVGAEAQTELAGHVINLVDDEHYAGIASYLTNSATSETVLEVFMADLYNRENSLKLPLMLTIAKDEKHPSHEEARDLLELYLEEDHGTDWAAWETKMKGWLKENPDKEN